MKRFSIVMVFMMLGWVSLFAKSAEDSLSDLVDSVESKGHKKTVTVTETTTTVTEVIVTTNYIEDEDEAEIEVETVEVETEAEEDGKDRLINIDIEINPGWLHGRASGKVSVEEDDEVETVEFNNQSQKCDFNKGDWDAFDGGYGGPVIQYTTIAGQEAYLSGGEGAFIFNKYWIIGGGGYGLVSSIPSPGGNQDLELDFGYGGAFVGFRLFPSWNINLTGYCFAGLGHIGYKNIYSEEEVNDGHSFAILEPGIDLNVKLLDWLTLSAGVRYQQIYYLGDTMPDITPDQFDEYTFLASVKFGWF